MSADRSTKIGAQSQNLDEQILESAQADLVPVGATSSRQRILESAQADLASVGATSSRQQGEFCQPNVRDLTPTSRSPARLKV